MNNGWGRARKKPIEIEFREVEPREEFFDTRTREFVKGEQIRTREGVLYARCGLDLIIRGGNHELYPIDRKIFERTYEEVPDDSA